MDYYVIEGCLPVDLEYNIYQSVLEEVDWKTMSHRGGQVPRMVAVQAQSITNNDGEGTIFYPCYRHPADDAPKAVSFLPSIERIVSHLNSLLGRSFNHVLIQYYRTGLDLISEHADKTLDVVHESPIVNLSLGCTRAMTLRSKCKDARSTCRVLLQHNSLFVMGPITNRHCLHGIRPDKVPESVTNGRISLTFREIATYVSEDQSLIFGQGSTSKTRPVPVVQDPAEAERMVRAFGTENQSDAYVWNDTYGAGFDVLHCLNVSPITKCTHIEQKSTNG